MSQADTPKEAITVAFAERNSAFGVTQKLWQDVAKLLHCSESEVAHFAIFHLAGEMGLIERGQFADLPTDAQLEALRRRVGDTAPDDDVLESSSLLGVDWEGIVKIGQPGRSTDQ